MGKLEIAYSDARFVSGHGFSRAVTTWFWEGHDFSRAVTAAKLMGLQPLRFRFRPAGILRDYMPDSNSKLEKI